MQNRTGNYVTFFRLKLIQILILLISFTAFAQPETHPVNTLDNNQPEFNAQQANKTFDQLNLQLSVENLNIAHLEKAINALNKLIDDAKNSINFYQKKMSNLDNLIKEAETSKPSDKTASASDQNKGQEKVGADLLYLKQEQKNIANKIAECRLFTIRAQEAITSFQTAISKIKQQQVLTRGLSLLALWDHLPKEDNDVPKIISEVVQAPIISQPFIYLFCITTAFCIFISAVIIKQIKSISSIKRVFRVKQIGILDSLLLASALMVSCFTLYYVYTIPNVDDTTQIISTLLILSCCYFWGLVMVTAAFKSKVVSAAFCWYSLDYNFFKNVSFFLVTYYSISKIGKSIVQNLTINTIKWQLTEIIFLSLAILIIVRFIYYFGYVHRHITFIRKHQKLLQRLFASLFLACGTLNIMGYHLMAIHLMYATITSFAITFSLFLFMSAVQKIHNICAYSSPTNHLILGALGYKAGQTVMEFMIIKITIQIILFSIGIYLIGETWAYGSYYIDTIYSQILNGISFSSFTFYPTRIVAGILTFCILYLMFRMLATKLTKHNQFEDQNQDQEQSQVAIASILIYTGFSCALVAALLVSGIDFTGLAIVAGALSVGIGLGLQSIVNNFVSGIILLIEKPIKSGDHIHIDNIEGVVKKIRIRSTQITTSAREDVIVPNSDLITKAVVNYMYTDRHLSIFCEVAVTYDSDPALVKKLLLQAVADHEEIIKPPRAKTTVLFHKFGDSAMIFQLWFVIMDGNKKAVIRSDINFTIDRLFRDNQIKIAHPQRDVHIKLSEIPSKMTDNQINS